MRPHRLLPVLLGIAACGGAGAGPDDPTAASAPDHVIALGGQTLVSARQAESYQLVEGSDVVTVKLSTDGLWFVIVGVREGPATLAIQRTFETERVTISVRAGAEVPLGVFDETHALTLAPGAQHPIPGVGVRAFSTGPEAIMDVVVSDDGRTMFMEARSPGHTSLLIFMEPARTVYYDIEVALTPQP